MKLRSLSLLARFSKSAGPRRSLVPLEGVFSTPGKVQISMNSLIIFSHLLLGVLLVKPVVVSVSSMYFEEGLGLHNRAGDTAIVS